MPVKVILHRYKKSSHKYWLLLKKSKYSIISRYSIRLRCCCWSAVGAPDARIAAGASIIINSRKAAASSSSEAVAASSPPAANQNHHQKQQSRDNMLSSITSSPLVLSHSFDHVRLKIYKFTQKWLRLTQIWRWLLIWTGGCANIVTKDNIVMKIKYYSL